MYTWDNGNVNERGEIIAKSKRNIITCIPHKFDQDWPYYRIPEGSLRMYIH